MASLRDRILQSQRGKLRREPVDLCGETVWAWGLTAPQRDELEESRIDQTAPKGTVRLKMVGFRLKVLMMGTRDSGDDGAKLVFSPGDEVQYLDKLPAEEIDRVVSKILELSGMSADAKDEKKSSFTQTGDSSPDTSSPDGSAAPSAN